MTSASREQIDNCISFDDFNGELETSFYSTHRLSNPIFEAADAGVSNCCQSNKYKSAVANAYEVSRAHRFDDHVDHALEDRACGHKTLFAPDGIEVWNSKYDGRYAPRPGTFRLLARLQARKPQMRAFYGQDMHWKKQHRGLFNIAECKSATREEILAAFARGNYYAVKEKFELPSSGKLNEDLLAQFGSVNQSYARKRRLIKQAKKMIDRVGLRVPAPLKAQLRRIF